MKTVAKTVFRVLLLAWLVIPVSVSAETHLSGKVGVDLGSYGFRNNIFAEGIKFDSDRRLANEFLNLDLNGPLVNGYFATYNATMLLRTTQIRSETDGATESDNINPEIANYHGSLSLFPNRSFPLSIYTGRSEENLVRYEPANRSEFALVDPGLAVVRRYASTSKETGALWRWAVRPDLEVSTELKQTSNQVERQYDFDENKNIWVDFMQISPGVAPYYRVDVVNTIPDRDVLLYVDFAFADTVKAGSTITISVEEGIRDLDFVPVGLNSYSKQIDLASDMQWKIFFNDPVGSKNIDQQNDIVTGKLRYDDGGAFKTEAYFEYNDGQEDVQDMVTNLQVFNNLATYNFSRDLNLTSLTTYSSNLADVGVISHQLSKMFLQQTTGKWTRSGGLSATASHSITKMSADTGAELSKSTNNILTGRLNYPTRWQQHEVGLLLHGNFLSDDKGYANDMVSAELANKLEFRGIGIRWRPQHTFKSSTNTSKNPDATSDELESKMAIDGERPNLWVFGDMRVKGQYDWRRKVNDVGTDTKNHYLAEMSFTKKFGRDHKLMLMAGVDNESFSFNVDESDIEIPTREDEVRKSLRFDLVTAPTAGVDVGINGMWVTTNNSRITKYSANVSIVLPIIDLPIRSMLISENRELEGLAPQKLFQLETKVSYNFRRISLVVSHRLTDETLITENYVYSEFLGKISRNFDVF